MENSAAISINEVKKQYGIKQATAYKWRNALRSLGLAETWDNYDRINSREINLSNLSVSTLVKSSADSSAATVDATVEPIQQKMTDSSGGFGLSIGRLQELNKEAELEVLIKSKLKDYHESNLQSQRSQHLTSKIEEVRSLDPKKLGIMLANAGVG